MRLGLGVSVLGLQQIITIWWLKQQISSLTVLEARSLRSRGQQGHAPSKGSEGGCLLLSASDIPLVVAAHLQARPVSTWLSSPCPCVSDTLLHLLRTPVTEVRIHPKFRMISSKDL